MIHEQRYSPDTCGCVFLETWDDAVPPIERVHVLRTREVTCAFHAADIPAIGYSRVYDENRRKNVSIFIMKAQHAAANETQVQWSFDANRNLIVTGLAAFGINAQKLKTIQDAIDLQFGVGKVLLSL